MQEGILISALSLKVQWKKEEEPFTYFVTLFSYHGKSCFSSALIKHVVAQRKLFPCEGKG